MIVTVPGVLAIGPCASSALRDPCVSGEEEERSVRFPRLPYVETLCVSLAMPLRAIRTALATRRSQLGNRSVCRPLSDHGQALTATQQVDLHKIGMAGQKGPALSLVLIPADG